MSDEEIDATLSENGYSLSGFHRTLTSYSGGDSSHRSSSEADRQFPRRLTPVEHTTPRTIPNPPQSPEADMYGISPHHTYFPDDHHFYNLHANTRYRVPHLIGDSHPYSHDPLFVEGPTERRQSLQRESMLKELSRAIQTATHRRDRPSEKVVTRHSLAVIWSESRLEKFIDLVRPGFDDSWIGAIREEWLQTLSILVDIGWQDWGRFGDIFLRHRDENGELDRSDRRIPTYTLAILEDDSFLGSPWAEKFQASQYTFCPIDIEEGKSLMFSKEWKLPFINETSASIGTGAYGRVTKEIIGSGHFRSRSEHHLPGAPYNKDIAVALKQFEARGDFRSETKNLDVLRSSLSKHDRIVPFLATVTIGNSFNILSPLAEMDLDVFLREGHQRCPDFTVRDLMQEAAHLAGALAFLHQGLDSHPPGLTCCHMDLKPGNILVFQGDSLDYPKVGKWKISDFGISIMSQPERTGTTVTEFVDTFTHRERPRPPPGPYQSPDSAGLGLKSDIWSLGCILTRVLALGLEGANGMMHLDQLRGTTDDGVSPYENDYFYRGSPPVVNPHVQTWLSGLVRGGYNYNPEFLERCRSLIVSMLSINHDERPGARDVQEQLHYLADIARPVVPRPPSTNTSVGGSVSIGSGSDNIRFSNRESRLREERLILHAISLLDGDVTIEERIWHDDDRLLIHVVRLGLAFKLENLLALEPGLDLETPDSNGETPLKIAVSAKEHHAYVAEILLNAGVNIDAPSRRGVTPLMAACRHGNVSAVRLLLERGADCSRPSQDGYTSLHYATYSEDGAKIIQLLQGRVSFNIRRSHNDETPLLTLIKRYDGTESWWDKFGKLLQGSADINMADANRFTPLSLAVEEDRSQLAAVLLKQGAEYGERLKPRHLSSDMAKVLKNAQPRGRRESQDSTRPPTTRSNLIRRFSTFKF
ncbi:putative 2-5A-dependent ribonuclease [Aspergillus bombycis]|uniref:Putative 2-5A-dependent ribonuclease n=1 Tax=Aspergillus bombycis TaxID=109264 RepID=A0A1F8AIV1_9EURO|nr:putative 2-5A-dependent ribonuclease [Aspergillus bombycis]OGM51379.1 putative 2-5A-dependent ribonuclease [Aspergillus bombycis]